MKQKITIEVNVKFNKIKALEGPDEDFDKHDIERYFLHLFHKKVEEFIIDEEMNLQRDILDDLDDEYSMENIDCYSDLGEVQINISEEGE